MAKLVLLPARDEQSDGHTHELFITTPNDATKQASAKGAQSTERHPLGDTPQSDRCLRHPK